MRVAWATDVHLNFLDAPESGGMLGHASLKPGDVFMIEADRTGTVRNGIIDKVMTHTVRAR